MRPDTHCTGGWTILGAVWTGRRNLALTGISHPDRPARSLLLYWLSSPGRPVYRENQTKHNNTICGWI